MFNFDISSLLAHHLFASTGFLGNEDQDIAFHFGNTTQPKALFHAFGIDEFFLFLLPRAHMGFAGADVEFLEMPFFDPDLALPTNPLLPTQGLDVHTEQPCGFDQGNSFWYFSPSA